MNSIDCVTSMMVVEARAWTVRRLVVPLCLFFSDGVKKKSGRMGELRDPEVENCCGVCN